jgi:phage terminase large subunit GpA-like protein
MIASRISKLIEAQGSVKISELKPHEWVEQNRLMTSEESPFPGYFSYDRTPYTKAIVDCLSPDHPAKKVGVMKGAQIGFSVGVIEGGIGYLIANAPGNIMLLTGHSDLSKESMEKIDRMIDNSGIRPLIRPNSLRKKNQKTGDTDERKQFAGGSLVVGSASNHKLLRQRSINIAFIDDFEAAKGSSKESGSTAKMIEQRLAAYEAKMKLFYISTPELRSTSNIEPEFLKGDQRYWHIPCPCCGTMIIWFWQYDKDGKKGGMYWELDKDGRLIRDSVKYQCYECGGMFDDSNKNELLRMGEFIPTATPKEDGYYSFHISSLYAPTGMKGWAGYVQDYIEAYPQHGQPDPEKVKTFKNLVLGETYEQEAVELNAAELQRNIQPYKIGVVPERLSIEQGGGRVLILTISADMNGKEDDARLDWEIKAWTENGTSYSITHGSIGTFVPLEARKGLDPNRRDRWTYHHNQPRSVWPEFEKVINQQFPVEGSTRIAKPYLAVLDSGHYTEFAYTFVDNTNCNVYLVKGDSRGTSALVADKAKFKPALERSKLFILQVNKYKDEVAASMGLKWNESDDQPQGFMNFPMPSEGMYSYADFFSHYEAETKKTMKNGREVAPFWEKKNNAVQNHFWDVEVYNRFARDLVVWQFGKESGITRPTWGDMVAAIFGK